MDFLIPITGNNVIQKAGTLAIAYHIILILYYVYRSFSLNFCYLHIPIS